MSSIQFPNLDIAQILKQRQLQKAIAQPSANTSSISQEPPNESPAAAAAMDEAFKPNYGPATSAYQQALAVKPPDIREYHPSIKRRIGSVLAGAATGFGNPDNAGTAGAQVAQAVINSPFKRQMTAYEQNLDNLKTQADTEQATQSNWAKTQHLKYEGEAEVARKQAEVARREKEQFEISPEAFSQKMKLAEASHPGSFKPPQPLKLKNGEEIIASFDPRTNQYKKLDGSVIDPEAIDPESVKNAIAKELSSIPAVALNVFRATHGNKNPETWQELDEVNSHIPQPGVTEGRLATAAAAQQKAASVSPQTVQILTNSVLKNPDTFESLDKEQQALVTVTLAQQGLPAPNKLPTEAKNREINSIISAEHARVVRSMLEDKRLLERIGPILGRLGKTEQYVGGSIPNVPPDLQEKAQELRSRLRYLVFQEGRSVLGGQRAMQLMKQLEQVSPDPRMTLPMLLGSLDAVVGTSKINRESANNYRWNNNLPMGQKPEGIPDNPQEKWRRSKDGKIIQRSTDGGTTWQTVSQ